MGQCYYSLNLKSDAIESVETRFVALKHRGDHAAAVAILLLTFIFFLGKKFSPCAHTALKDNPKATFCVQMNSFSVAKHTNAIS